MSIFAKYAQYYNLLYSEKNYELEAAYIDVIIKKYNPKASTILEFGCGTGKHAAILATQKYKIHGIDISSEMVACAKKTVIHQNTAFTCGDIRKINMLTTFDVILSLFHVISYQTTNNDLNAVFSKASAHLCSGGLFIFDAWYGPAVLAEKPSIRIKRAEDQLISVVRIAEPVLFHESNCVDVTFTIFFQTKKTKFIESFVEKHTMRYLFVADILELCKNHNFEFISSSEWLTDKALSCSSWGACFILRKQ
jgi:SAM-dependent methyltransferase